MGSKEIILGILESGDNLLINKTYVEAFYEYEQAFPVISSLHAKSIRADSIGTFTGWTTGFLTGGIGIEDLFIIPIVSKGVSKALGSDHEYLSQLISMLILRQINCILASDLLQKNLIKEKVLQKFALLFASTQDKKTWEKISHMFFAGMLNKSALSNQDAMNTPYYYLFDEVKKYLYGNDISFLLFNYLNKINDDSELFHYLKDVFSDEAQPEYDRNTSMHSQIINPDDYYEILGVQKGSTKDEIRKAYYEIIKKYHPDKFASLSAEFQDLANKKAQLINEAYDYLMRE